MSFNVAFIKRTALAVAVLICSASAFAQGGVTNETLQESKKNLKPTNSPAAQEMAKSERKAPTPNSQPFGTPPPATYAPSHPNAELRGKPMNSANAPTISNSQYQNLPNNAETVGARQGPNGHYSDPPAAPGQQVNSGQYQNLPNNSETVGARQGPNGHYSDPPAAPGQSVNSGQYQNLPNNSETVGARQGPNGHYSDPPAAPGQSVDPSTNRQKSQVTIGQHRQQPQQYTKLDLGPEGNRAANARAESNARARGIEPVYQNAPNGSVNNPAQRQYQIPNPPPGGGYQQLPKSQGNAPQQYTKLDLGPEGNRAANARAESNARAKGIDPVYQNAPNGSANNPAQRQYQVPNPPPGGGYQQLPKSQAPQYQAIDLTDRPRNQTQQYQAIDLTDRNNPSTGSTQNQLQRQYQVPNPPPGGGYQQLQTSGAQPQQYERLDLGNRQPEVNARAESNARARGIEPVYQNTPNGNRGNQAQRQYQIPDPASSDRYQQLEKRPNGQYSAPPVGGNAPVNGQYAAPPVGGNAPVNGQYAAPPVGGNAPVNGQYAAPPVGGNAPVNGQYAAPPVGGNAPVNGQYQQLKVNPPEKPSRANKPNLNNPPEKPSRASKPNLNNPPEKPSRASKPNLNNPPEKPSRANKPNLNNPPEKPSRANKPKLNSSSVKPARTNIRPASSGKSGGSTRPKTRSPR